jgi:MFS family permease
MQDRNNGNNSNKGPSKQSLRGLDYTNFFLADTREGTGSYTSVYLKGFPQWNPATIGVAVAISTITQVLVQIPAGALVDWLPQKRLLMVISAALTGIGLLGVAFIPTNIPVVIGTQVLSGIAAAIFMPTLAALAKGLVEDRKLDRRIGRSETFYHAGNLVFALIAALIGQFIARAGIFVFLACYTGASAISVLQIRARDINYQRARGGAEDDEGDGQGNQQQYSGIFSLLRDRRILLFALAIVLFHFANSPMLPLVGQVFEEQAKAPTSIRVDSTVYMAAAIITAQLSMTPTANLAGRLAGSGRKRVFLVGFAAIPLRGVLFAFSQNPFYLIAVQLLDGIGAGIFWVVAVLMIADLTKGTGRFNFTQGFVSTCYGIGDGVGNLLAGFVANAAGYPAAFLTLAAIGLGGLAVFWFFVPETKEQAQPAPA